MFKQIWLRGMKLGFNLKTVKTVGKNSTGTKILISLYVIWRPVIGFFVDNALAF